MLLSLFTWALKFFSRITEFSGGVLFSIFFRDFKKVWYFVLLFGS